MKLLIPLFFILIAGTIFFAYINPAYLRIQGLRAEEAQFDQALNKSKELQATRDQLLSKYNTFSPDDLGRLTKFLPDSVDNVRLILDLNSIASRYGMRTRNVSLQTKGSSAARAAVGAVGPSTSPYGSVVLSFSVSGSYPTFIAFLEDLERSLRLTDVVGVSFTANDTGTYNYDVAVRTYWLTP